MSTRTVSFHTLVCDGCQVQFGMDAYHPSQIEVRAAAYNAGWRFPERYRARGGESKTVNDVCGECHPTWVPKAAPNNWANRKTEATR